MCHPNLPLPNDLFPFPYPPTWIWKNKLTCVFHVYIIYPFLHLHGHEKAQFWDLA
jgi:hypothetical protein